MQLCCIFLLIFAQQTALTHTLWHAAGGHESHASHAHDGDADDHESERQLALCDYHIAFGTLLGGHHGAPAAFGTLDTACAHGALHFSGRVTAEAVPTVSRGPPLLL